MKTTSYLDAARAKLGLPSDYALARHLGVPKETISNYRSGRRAFSNDIAARLAEILELDPLQVIADAELERATHPQKKELWQRIAATFGKAAALAVMSATPFLLPPPAQAGNAPVLHNVQPEYTLRRNRRRKVPAWLAALGFLLGGCSTIDTHNAPPRDWPELAIFEHRVDAATMHERCAKYVGFLMIPLACAEVNFVARRCDIWLTEHPWPAVVEHERLHCRGYDHPGDSAMRDAWITYRDGATGSAAARARP
jgi:plasmid maintenance system antidote protein VapI/uncharacterized protein YceK